MRYGRTTNFPDPDLMYEQSATPVRSYGGNGNGHRAVDDDDPVLDLARQVALSLNGNSHRLRDPEYRASVAQAVAEALQKAALGRKKVHIAQLEPHQRDPKDKVYDNAVLRWNMAAGQQYTRSDVALHLHGYVNKGAWIQLDYMDETSGLRFEHPSGASPKRSRSRYTLGIVPHGRRLDRLSKGGDKQVVDFPKLTGSAGEMTAVIHAALDLLATTELSQKAGSLSRARLILTAHSGGGGAVESILSHTDPFEIQLYDAVYSDGSTLGDWAARKIADDARELAKIPKPERWPEFMDSAGHSLRCVYGAGTKGGSLEIEKSIVAALAKISNPDIKAAIRPYYRAEPAGPGVGHNEIPKTYGPQMMTRNYADLEHPPAPAPAPKKTAAPKAHELASKTKDEIVQELNKCGLVPSSVTTYSEYTSKVLVKDKVFGQNVTLHPDFLAKVKAAETALRSTKHGISDTSSLRTGSSSYHGWGMAIDLNPGKNPYVMHEAEDAPGKIDEAVGPVYTRIALFMLGRTSHIPSGLSALAKKSVADAHAALKAESDAVPNYFALPAKSDSDLQSLIDGKSFDWKKWWKAGAKPTPAELRKQINDDYDPLRGKQPPPSKSPDAPFKNVDPKKAGFLDLSVDLVKAMKAQKMRWGAIDLSGASGDVMHFDDGFSPMGKFIYEVKYGKKPSCPA